jgi:hypothetical protein
MTLEDGAGRSEMAPGAQPLIIENSKIKIIFIYPARLSGLRPAQRSEESIKQAHPFALSF